MWVHLGHFYCSVPQSASLNLRKKWEKSNRRVTCVEELVEMGAKLNLVVLIQLGCDVFVLCLCFEYSECSSCTDRSGFPVLIPK